MLLAGGQGSRLYALTSKIAKPAVPYGAKYRIIDFPLSNCVNSNIDTVGVLTQYQPLVLSEYIGNGQPWDLDRAFGGVHILPPYQEKTGARWYRGTANAIYQNLNFIRAYSPKYVLVLSGDHIYKMDYSEMIAEHERTGADCTIAVIRVPKEEASRFGIISTDEDGRITKFEEKPKTPHSDLASMGVYVFSTEKLFRYLIEDDQKESSSNDFGKDVIPAMLRGGERMFAHSFKGYWKDVGTVQSLWEANMDLLSGAPAFDIFEPSWRIHSRNPIQPPHYAGEGSLITNSLVSGGCEIYGSVQNSLLSHNVRLGRGASVKDSVIMAGVEIGEGAVIEYSIIDENVRIGKHARIGAPLGRGEITVIGRDVTLEDRAEVDCGSVIEQSI